MSAEAKLLVVDDEFNILELLATSLRFAGFEVVTAGNGREAIEKAENEQPDLIVLDVMMPGMDGFEVTRRLRDAGRTYPVLFLTAKDATEDKVAGLGAGGDDYVTKPFSMDELLARIRVLTRRIGQDEVDEEPIVAFGSVWVDLAAHTVTRDGANVRLTPTEWRVLELLIRNEGRLVTRQTMLSQVWGSEHVTDTGYLRLYISQLRKKLEPEPSRPRYLITDAGMGYRLVLDP